MKIFILSVFALVTSLFMLSVGSTPTDAASRVRGYTKSNGTYVQPYYRSSPNSTRFDNYSTRGNYNPYSGKWGTRNPWRF